jgi:hypothetical protein
MASVVSVKELARKGVFEIGKSRTLTRELVCVLSDDALTSSPIDDNQLVAATGVNIGTAHPFYTFNKCRKITITEGFEGSPYHVHILYEYGVILAYELQAPTDRPGVWEFDGAPGEVPALFYYAGNDNSTKYPLTNSAYDYFPGLVTQEALSVARVTYNFATFPTNWFAASQCVNDATYFGCPAHSVKLDKISVQQTQEEFNGGTVAYWKATAELHYRQSGHSLQLPDVGFNFILSNQKRRAMVFDFENAEWVASPGPVGLDGNGGMTLGAPAILVRRVNPVVNFTTLFGNPPTTPLPTG